MRALLPLFAMFPLALVGCGVEGGGTPVPFLPADFPAGSKVPAWLLSLAGANLPPDEQALLKEACHPGRTLLRQ